MMKDAKTAIEWIHSRLPFGIRPGLKRIYTLLDWLDNPQDKIKTVHVGGTNGKGSTVATLRCLLEEQGLTVGTYTSPYITIFNERISLNGQPIPDQDLLKLVNRIIPLVEQMDKEAELNGVTEFEIMTAMMFEYFYEKQVDIAIIEVGLGGTLDCTNVIHPLASAIVTVGYDHMDILGNTLAEIAEQKSGIIKEKTPVVVGRLPEEALAVVKKKAIKMNSPIYNYNQEYHVKYLHPAEKWGEVFMYSFNKLESSNKMLKYETPLLGQHQADNTAVAITLFKIVAEKLHLTNNATEIQKGLSCVNWPGRMERVSQEPLVILDGAHNQPAVEALVQNLKNEFPNKQIYFVFAAISTKDITTMMKLIESLPEHTIVGTTFDYPRAVSVETLQKDSPEVIVIEPDWQKAVSKIWNRLDSDSLLVVTGSLYFISQVRHWLSEKNI